MGTRTIFIQLYYNLIDQTILEQASTVHILTTDLQVQQYNFRTNARWLRDTHVLTRLPYSSRIYDFHRFKVRRLCGFSVT